MWVFTKDGYFSTVVHRESEEIVIVRARCRDDLTRFAANVERVEWTDDPLEIFHTPQADYPYRIICHRDAWINYLILSAQDMDYDNFKNANPERAKVYSEVWWTLHALQD